MRAHCTQGWSQRSYLVWTWQSYEPTVQTKPCDTRLQSTQIDLGLLLTYIEIIELAVDRAGILGCIGFPLRRAKGNRYAG